jgi:aminoglycoside phosphotransferase (APT) family kinase protein
MTDDDRWVGMGRWLAPRLGTTGEVRVVDPGAPAGVGYSAETVVFTAEYRTDAREQSRRFVLRAETPDPPVYPAQAPGFDVEIEIQRAVMHALAAASDVPLAPIFGAEADAGVIGTPFFVMDFVEGEVPPVDPPYPAAGFFADAAPGDRTRMIEDGLRVMAGIHAVDWRAAGLDWLVPAGAEPTLRRQLDLWEAYARRELGERRHPVLERAFRLLGAELSEPSPPALCWGDPRPGNMIWRDFRCACVTDWEAAAIAPAELDLGWWLMFDRSCHEVPGIARLDGEPTREEQRELYAAAAGRAVGDTWLHEVFAAARYAAIVVRVMNRAVERGHMPADHTIWLENPAATCLVQLLDERG